MRNFSELWNGGTVRGTGSYSYGSTVTISAIPNEGYMFEGWYENGRCLDNISDEYTFTAFANRTIEAKFVPNDLTISNVEVIGDKEPEETLIFRLRRKADVDRMYGSILFTKVILYTIL